MRMRSTIASEHVEQVALFNWADFQRLKMPELQLLHAIPNGGKRDRITAARLKAEGVRAGVPDIFLPVAREPWHGLYIELKTRRGRVTEHQKRWIVGLREQGYMAAVCRGWHPASALIKAYLAGEDFTPQQGNRMTIEQGTHIRGMNGKEEYLDLGVSSVLPPPPGVTGYVMKVRKITTTDEAKVQVVLETEGASDESLEQLKAMLTLQQTCPVSVSMSPVQRDLFDA